MNNETVRILIADDNPAELDAFTRILVRTGYQILSVDNGQSALEIIKKNPIDVLLTDLNMPFLNGHELLRSAKALKPELEIVIITGEGSVESAVNTLKAGAYDFIEKPFKRIDLLKTIEKALEKQRLYRENRKLSHLLEQYQADDTLIGSSPPFNEALEIAEQVAQSEATVLIQGESGTGKELFASLPAVHLLN
jgi:two-component system, NtrC family, response regulator HydG